MTGLLAVSGIVLVLLASAYSGLTASDSTTTDTPTIQITPVRDAGDSDANVTVTPAPTEIPAEPTPPPATPTQVTNRENCAQIRGTDYFSPQERTWFLANCVNN